MIGLSPAKINAFFRVIEKRSDGYHSIASLFQAIDLFDRMSVERASEDQFISNVAYLNWDPSNLIYKALDRFRQKTGILDFVSIQLEKNIPIGAGLGGGSSNAATTLYLINEIFGKPLSISELKEIGGSIGADVPFFFSSGSAYCTGIGEITEDVKPLQPTSLYLVVPHFCLQTPLVYKNCRPGEVSQEDPESILQRTLDDGTLGDNDLEPAAFRVNPIMREIKNQLLPFGKVTMTGSGSGFLVQGKRPDIHENYHVYPIRPISKNSLWF